MMSSNIPNFAIGSTFVCSLDGSKSFVATWRVAESETIFLNTATLAPQCCYYSNVGETGSGALDMVSLSFASPPECPHPLPLCSFHVKSPQCYTVPSLGIQVSGPREITVKATFLNGSGHRIPEKDIPTAISVSLFGFVVPNSSLSSTSLSSTSAAVVLVTQDREGGGGIEEPIQQDIVNDTTNLGGCTTENKKEGSLVEETTTDKKRNLSLDYDNSAERTLSKKARKELAKRKQEQLAKVIESELHRDHPSTEAAATTTTNITNTITTTTKPSNEIKGWNKNTKGVNVISQRRLHGGVIVKDIIIGSGQTAKQGRKVSILYVGSLASNGNVFDKNQNHSKPLQFRLGTGQVIRGLDIGLEGMKVGGERHITIPPELGYGNKSMGDKIPKNSTLVFQVRLI
jgi:FKBP-type peptidyl-prolyl cis-trans isomerase